MPDDHSSHHDPISRAADDRAATARRRADEQTLDQRRSSRQHEDSVPAGYLVALSPPPGQPPTHYVLRKVDDEPAQFIGERDTREEATELARLHYKPNSG
jgi:hypothetical protein